MRIVGQIFSVCAIALGVGLLVGGFTIDPANRIQDLGELAEAINRRNHDYEFHRDLSASLKGAGAAFLALGSLGLLVPWANVLVYGRRSDKLSVPA